MTVTKSHTPGVLSDLCAHRFEAPALRAPEDPGPVSYRELADAVDHLADRFASFGIREGDCVALALPPGPEFVEILLAIASLGAAAAPLNPAYSESEFAFYLDDLRPRALLLLQGELEAARSAARSRAGLIDVMLEPGRAPSLTALEPTGEASADRSLPDPDRTALLLHTSGTTSRPKQVPLLHRNLMASAASIARHYELTAADVSYCAMPLFHIHGLVASTFAQLAVGGLVIVPRRVGPARFWSQLEEHGVTWYSASPTLHQMVLERAPDRRPDGLRLRFARSCSSALSPDLSQRAETYLGVPMLEAYGMTEASHEMSANPLPPGRRHPGSVGVPTGAEIRVVDQQGASVPEGDVGEVVIRGPGVMAGYLANDAANAEAFHGAWFRTGDQGRFEDGYLTLTGRIKEIIIRGGENISPYEVEAVLLLHDAVMEAVAYGIPDQKYGQLVGAAIVPGVDTTEAEIVAHCARHLANFKVPSVVHIVESIPRTPTGKVQRPRMSAHFGEG
ncbi:MAG: AMP-binding protein [Thermoleophilia bacterium]